MENKWRAARYGLDGMMIDFGREKELPERELILEYLDFVDDVLDELECRKEVEYVQTILDRGTGADRQLKVFSETDDLKKVVDTWSPKPRPACDHTGYGLCPLL